MCSDLKQYPVVAVELYCLRPRIEVMFDMLKNVLCVFSYRFWSQKMPRHSRKPTKNSKLKTVQTEALKTVKQCWNGIERFVMLGCIALGILQLIAIKYSQSVWEQYDGYLRTRSRAIPSERTVKYVLARLIFRDFVISSKNEIMRIIVERYFGCRKSSEEKEVA